MGQGQQQWRQPLPLPLATAAAASGGYWRRRVAVASARTALACGADLGLGGNGSNGDGDAFVLVRDGDGGGAGTLEVVRVVDDPKNSGGGARLRLVSRQPLLPLLVAAGGGGGGDSSRTNNVSPVRAMARVANLAAPVGGRDGLALLLSSGRLVLLAYLGGRMEVVASAQAPASGAGGLLPPGHDDDADDEDDDKLGDDHSRRDAERPWRPRLPRARLMAWAQDGSAVALSVPPHDAPGGRVAVLAVERASSAVVGGGGGGDREQQQQQQPRLVVRLSPPVLWPPEPVPPGQQVLGVTALAWRRVERPNDDGEPAPSANDGCFRLEVHRVRRLPHAYDLDWRPSQRALVLCPSPPPMVRPTTAVGQIADGLAQQRLSPEPEPEPADDPEAAAEAPPTPPPPPPPEPRYALTTYRGGRSAAVTALPVTGRVVAVARGSLPAPEDARETPAEAKARDASDQRALRVAADFGVPPPYVLELGSRPSAALFMGGLEDGGGAWRRRRRRRRGPRLTDLAAALAAAPKTERALVAYASGTLALYRATASRMVLEATLPASASANGDGGGAWLPPRPAEPRFGCVSAPDGSRLFVLHGGLRGVQVLTTAMPMAQLARRPSAFDRGGAGAGRGAASLWALELPPPPPPPVAATTAAVGGPAAAAVVVASFDGATRALALVRGGGALQGGARLRDATAELAVAGLEPGASTLAAGLVAASALLLQVTPAGARLVPLLSPGAGSVADWSPAQQQQQQQQQHQPPRVFAADVSGGGDGAAAAALVLTDPSAGARVVVLRAVERGPAPQQQLGVRGLKRSRETDPAAAAAPAGAAEEAADPPAVTSGADWELREAFACPLDGQVSCVHLARAGHLMVVLCGRYDGSVAVVVAVPADGAFAAAAAAAPAATVVVAGPRRLHGPANAWAADRAPVPHSIAAAGPSAVAIGFRDGRVGLYALALQEPGSSSSSSGGSSSATTTTATLRLLSMARTNDGAVVLTPPAALDALSSNVILHAVGDKRVWRLEVGVAAGDGGPRLVAAPLELLPPPPPRANSATASALALLRLPPWAASGARGTEALLISQRDGALVLAAAALAGGAGEEEEEEEEEADDGGGNAEPGAARGPLLQPGAVDGSGARVLGWTARGHDVRSALAIDGAGGGGALLVARCADDRRQQRRAAGGGGGGLDAGGGYLAAFDVAGVGCISSSDAEADADPALAQWRAPGSQEELICLGRWGVPRAAVAGAFGAADRLLSRLRLQKQQEERQLQIFEEEPEAIAAPLHDGRHQMLIAEQLRIARDAFDRAAAHTIAAAVAVAAAAVAAHQVPASVSAAAASAAQDPRSHHFDSGGSGGGGSGGGGAAADAPRSADGLMPRLIAAATAEVRAAASGAGAPWFLVGTRVPSRRARESERAGRAAAANTAAGQRRGGGRRAPAEPEQAADEEEEGEQMDWAPGVAAGAQAERPVDAGDEEEEDEDSEDSDDEDDAVDDDDEDEDGLRREADDDDDNEDGDDDGDDQDDEDDERAGARRTTRARARARDALIRAGVVGGDDDDDHDDDNEEDNDEPEEEEEEVQGGGGGGGGNAARSARARARAASANRQHGGSLYVLQLVHGGAAQPPPPPSSSPPPARVAAAGGDSTTAHFAVRAELRLPAPVSAVAAFSGPQVGKDALVRQPSQFVAVACGLVLAVYELRLEARTEAGAVAAEMAEREAGAARAGPGGDARVGWASAALHSPLTLVKVAHACVRAPITSLAVSPGGLIVAGEREHGTVCFRLVAPPGALPSGAAFVVDAAAVDAADATGAYAGVREGDEDADALREAAQRAAVADMTVAATAAAAAWLPAAGAQGAGGGIGGGVGGGVGGGGGVGVGGLPSFGGRLPSGPAGLASPTDPFALPLTLVPVAADEHARPAAAVALLSGACDDGGGGGGGGKGHDEDEGAAAPGPPHVLALDRGSGLVVDAAPLGPRRAVPWDGGMAERALLRVSAPALADAHFEPRLRGTASLAATAGSAGGGTRTTKAVLASTPAGDVVRLEWVPLPGRRLALAQADLLRALQRAALAGDGGDGDADEEEEEEDEEEEEGATDEVDADVLRALLLEAPAARRARVLAARPVRRAARRWGAALRLAAGQEVEEDDDDEAAAEEDGADDLRKSRLERAVWQLLEAECE